MKKKNVIRLILILIPQLFLVGVSTWVIISELIIEPIYIENSLSSYFGVSQSTVYNGSPQGPKISDDDLISEELLSYEYQYYNSENKTVYSGLPTNANTYDITIYLSNYDVNGNLNIVESCKVRFEIKKLDIWLKTTSLDINYGDCERYWASMKPKIEELVEFENVKGETVNIDEDLYGISSMTNGKYTYKGTDSSNIVGSTYAAIVNFTDDNYNLDSNIIIVKYKTCKIGNKFYTIEDALLDQSDLITFVGDSSSTTSYVHTSFCELSNAQGYPYSAYFDTDKSGNKLMEVSCNMLVPYNSTDLIGLGQSESNPTDKIYSCLEIPKNIHLKFKSGYKLTIGSIISSNGRVGIRGVVMNHGTITMDSGATLNSYGYLKGTGFINLLSGSSTVDVMVIFDWPGGNDASSVKDSIFPVVAWSAHNISCPTKIYSGALYSGYSSIVVSVLGYQAVSFKMIERNNNAGQCLFKPSSSTSKDDYILKKATNNDNNTLNTSITESNQTQGQRDVIEINGSYDDDSLSITLYVEFSTSPTLCVPVCYMDICVKSYSELNISSSSYVFLCGSSLTVEEEATLNIGDGVYVAFDTYDSENETSIICPFFNTYCKRKSSASFILNGYLSGSGSIGGIIDTSNDGAQITIQSFNVSSIVIKAGKIGAIETKTTSNYKLYGNIGNKILFEDEFKDETAYISTYTEKIIVLDDGETEKIIRNYYFMETSSVGAFTLNFYEKDGTPLGSKTLYVIENEDNPISKYYIQGNEFTPVKSHYAFVEWCLKTVNENGEITYSSAKNHELINGENNSIDLYASWSLIKYKFIYTFGVKKANGEVERIVIEDKDIENLIENFTINSFITINEVLTLAITTVAKYNDLVTDGWYVGTQEKHTTTKITEITESRLNLFVNQYGPTIPLYFEFIGYNEYIINILDNTSLEFETIKIKDGDTIDLSLILSETNKFDVDCDYQWYLEGCYFGNNEVKIENGSYFNEEKYKHYADDKFIINLNLNWIEKKFKVYYKNTTSDTTPFKTQYFNSSKSVTIWDGKTNGLVTAVKAESTGAYNTQYTFNNSWSLATDSNTTFSAGSKTSFSETTTLLAVYSEYNYCNVTVKNSTGRDGTAKISIYDSNNTLVESYTFEFLKNESKTLKLTYGYKYTQPDVGSSWGVSYNCTDDISGSKINKSGNYYLITTHQTLTVSVSCFAEGTLITLANGSYKKIEDLMIGDLVLVYNHYEGRLDVSPISYIIHDSLNVSNVSVINLKFSNNSSLRIISEHGLFDKTLNKYVYINELNVSDYINHEFYSETGDCLTLLDYYISEELIKFYSPITVYHLNCFAEGILTVTNFSNPATNIFEYDDKMMYNQDQILKEIEMYGLFSYKDFEQYTSYEVYCAFPAEYFKIAIMKGHTTLEEILCILNNFLQ